MILRWALVALAVSCSAPPRAGPGFPGGPAAPPATHPVGTPSRALIGAGGGSVSSTDGVVTLLVPQDALTADTDFTISALADNTAIGGTGLAYLLEPAVVFLKPVTITFNVASSAGLALSHQIALGYWLRAYDVQTTATTISVTTMDLGAWTAVTTATQQDLHGSFRLDTTTQAVPLHAQGDVTLQVIGSDPDFLYYIPTGSITPSSPGCDAMPASPLPLSMAELHPAASQQIYVFRWALVGWWQLACGGATPFVSTGFDTMGIDNIGCALSYTQAMPVSLSASHLAGQFRIDCGASGQVVASWDLVGVGDTPLPVDQLPPP